MSEIMENTAADRAADKLHKEAEAVSKLKGSGYPTGIMRELSGPICSMLVRFCYQEEEQQGTSIRHWQLRKLYKEIRRHRSLLT
jgi:hypothetical protein